MTVIAIEGKPRTGKTLLMTILAFADCINGSEIFSNYTMKFSQHPKMDVYDMLQIPFNDVDRNPKSLCIQEADKIFDSWQRTEENRLLSSLTGQSGKRNLNIYYDTQFYTRVQKSLRAVTEFKFLCSCYVRADTKQPVGFEYTLGESLGNDTFGVISKIRLPVDTKINGYRIDQYYNMYDSYETTQPLRQERN
jgi:hypothetical protein